MKTTTRVVVIGGGIGGCSTLYHLCQEGITDCVLLERDELTSGTTWHSAAQVTNFGGIQVMVGLKSHSIRLYKELADDPDYPINYHHGTGGLRLATQGWHWDGYRHFQSMARGMGVEFELIDPEECARRHPLISTDGLIGALWDSMDGDIDPAQLCQALARRARKAGAEVYRHTPVTGLRPLSDGWVVETEKGEITCEHVVNAGGYRCNEIGAMMGVELPVASMEHQYFLTDPIPEIQALDFRVPLIRCPEDDFYQRQEKDGLLVGFYEQEPKTWGMDGIDPGFTNALCPNDLDRISDTIEGACKRLPCLESAGIHTVINGPITYTPDGVPLVGRLPGRQNAWCITGLRAGLGEGGGHGWLLAQMIAHGEACYDTWALDPRRFGSWANQDYTALKAIEDYQNEFRFHRPHEHRPAGRPARTTPLTPVLEAAGAAFGVVNGWERALFFKPSPDFTDQHEFGFTPTKDVVAAEVACVRDRVGIMEVNGFNRIEIAGEGAAEWLARLIAGRIPPRVGKVGLCYALTDQGNVAIEATLARLGEDRFWWGSAAAAEDHDWDWLEAQRPEGVTLTRLTESHTILVLAGPGSRALLAELAPRGGWDDFPWLSLREVRIGQWPVMAMSVSFSGELAWELHIPNHALLGVYHMLVAAGEAHGLGHFGLYATESMRIEKGYRHWKADLITEFDPYESGLDRFVKLDHMFPGRSALEGRYGNDPSQLIQQEPRELPDQAETPSGERALAGASEAGVSSMHSGAASGTCSIGVLPGSAVAVGPQRGKRRAFVTLEVFTDTAPAHPGDSLYRDGRVVGTVTSAAWGHRVGKNLAMGFVEPDLSAETTEFSIELLGQTYPARVVAPCLYDPKNERLRA